ncbi:MAG: enoyl-CoA hydratase/isomerase family protein [Actinomycetota bacterium]|nr:enoyl-CoA hydratase/isomerase family protein [Actinomycetota bacterium]
MFEREVVDGVAVLRMTHGPANALDLELLQGIGDALEDIGASNAKALVITGRDTVFSAGAELFRVLEEGTEYLEIAGKAFDRAFEALFTFPRPVVAAINGHAVAGGCVIAQACDHRIAAAGGARIGLAELKVGVPFPTWALEIVRYSVPPPHFAELILTGRLCNPDEARTACLVDVVVPPDELLDAAVAMASRLARIPPATFALTKRAMRAPTLERVERYGPVADAEGATVWASDDVRASISAFLTRTFGTDTR